MPQLTDPECKNAKCPPDKKSETFADGGGLYLEVSPAGSKRWFLKYRKAGTGDKAGRRVQSRIALGRYPAVTLSQARKTRDEAKALIAKGIDPVQARKVEKLKDANKTANTFKATALDWVKLQATHWSDSYATRNKRNLEKDLFPFVGDRPMEAIHPMEILAVVQRVEDRGSLEAARRVLDTASQVFKHWLPMAPPNHRNVTEGLRARLMPRIKGHFAAITEPARFGELMRAIHGYRGGPLVRTALQLAPLLYQRPYNLRAMEWAELDLEVALWTIPSQKMKRTVGEKEHGAAHVVPLPTQAVALLQGLQPLTGDGKYVFPSDRSRDRPISDNSVRSALYALGFGKQQTWHGFRASARTMLVDELNADPLAIEANLAHAVKDSNGRSYNRTQYLKQRFEQIQIWADYCDKLAAGNVIGLDGKPIKAAA